MSAREPVDKKQSKDEEKDKKKKKEDNEKKDSSKKTKKKTKKDGEDDDEETELSPKSRTANNNSQPELKPYRQIEEHGPKEKLCFLHGQKLVYFCETCEEPICDKCILVGPHNNQLHRINSIKDAFLPRSEALRNVIDTKLVAKRQEVITQMQRIDNRIEKIKYVKNMIEKDIKAEFAKIIDKLRMAEGGKTAILLHSLSDFQKEVDKIDDLTATVLELTKENNDPTDLLIRMRQIADEIELTISRPIKKEIEVTPELPMDLEEQREKIEKMKIAQEIIDFKDNVITQLLIEKEDKYDSLKAELKDQYEKLKADIQSRTTEEIDGWLRIAERCNDLIKDNQLVCFFCGEVLDDVTVNSVCSLNNRISIPISFEGYTEEFPDKLLLGKLRHCFGHAIPEATDITQSKVNGSRAAKVFESKVFRMQFRLQLEIMLSKIKKYYISKAEELEKLFKSNDKGNKGVVSGITFAYILHEACGVEMKEVERLQSLLDPEKQNQIKYLEMLKLFKEPSYLREFINSRFPQLNENELVRGPRQKGPLRSNILGEFESVVNKPISRFGGSVIPTSGRAITPNPTRNVSGQGYTGEGNISADKSVQNKYVSNIGVWS